METQTLPFFFDYKNHEFGVAENANGTLYESVKLPLSMIVQVTRRCNLTCSFCSESEQFTDPTYESLLELKDKLKGVQRIYLSGGEPLLRDDIIQIIDEYANQFPVLGLPTNSIFLTNEVYAKLRGKIHYINCGLDGPRKINDKIRGGYKGIINGLRTIRNSGIEVSLSTVIMKMTLPYLKFVVQIADDLDLTKVKMVIPVPRGRANSLSRDEYVPKEEIIEAWEEIKFLKKTLGWKPRVKFTFWDKTTEGYALLIYPNREVHAWPVLDAPESVLYLGNLYTDTLEEIWARYPYKKNHIDKYCGITMHKA